MVHTRQHNRIPREGRDSDSTETFVRASITWRVSSTGRLLYSGCMSLATTDPIDHEERDLTEPLQRLFGFPVFRAGQEKENTPTVVLADIAAGLLPGHRAHRQPDGGRVLPPRRHPANGAARPRHGRAGKRPVIPTPAYGLRGCSRAAARPPAMAQAQSSRSSRYTRCSFTPIGRRPVAAHGLPVGLGGTFARCASDQRARTSRYTAATASGGSAPS